VVGLTRPNSLRPEPAGVCADEENAVAVASKKVIESFAMFKVPVPDLSFSSIVALRQP
jgi:hypothetical protein